MVREYTDCDFSPFKFIKICFRAKKMVYLVLDKQCLLLPLCGVFYNGQLSCLIVLFMFAVPFLIFCLVVLSINKNGISSLSTLYYFLLLILSIFASCIWRCYIFIQERLKHKGMYTNVHGSFIHHSKKKKKGKQSRYLSNIM